MRQFVRNSLQQKKYKTMLNKYQFVSLANHMQLGAVNAVRADMNAGAACKSHFCTLYRDWLAIAFFLSMK